MVTGSENDRDIEDGDASAQTELFAEDTSAVDHYEELRSALVSLLRSGYDHLVPAEKADRDALDIASMVAALESRDNKRSATPEQTELAASQPADSVDQGRTDQLERALESERQQRIEAEAQQGLLQTKLDEVVAGLANTQFDLDGKHSETVVLTEQQRGQADRTAQPANQTGATQLETRLRITQLDNQEIEFVVDRSDVTIGRTNDSDIHLKSSSVSRRHARIVREDGQPKIMDCGSKNGVFVNAFRIDEQVLQDGDQITIGNVELTFKERVRR